MKLNGAQIFFECLKKEKVEVIFGFPGGAVLDLYHELPNSGIRHILVRHEQGAAHMAGRVCARQRPPSACAW